MEQYFNLSDLLSATSGTFLATWHACSKYKHLKYFDGDGDTYNYDDYGVVNDFCKIRVENFAELAHAMIIG